jgi:cell wall-associated NlpC family hydrolase
MPTKGSTASATEIVALHSGKMSDQLEALAEDIDIVSFQTEIQNELSIDLTNTISSAIIQRTIEGASTLTIVVEDDLDRTIQNSGRLGRHVDVELDGLYFTLVGVKKQARQLTLVFEDREVNVLRYYNSFIQADRTNVTRAQFVLRMIREVKEVPLSWVIPELHVTQAISDIQPNQVIYAAGTPQITPATDPVTKQKMKKERAKGIPSPQDTHGLTVRGAPMDTEQWQNAVTIINTGVAMKCNTKVIVSSIMTAIDESNIRNLTGGDRDSVGVFQQRPSMGWPASRNVATDTAAYLRAAVSVDQGNPQLSLNDLCQSVQHSGTPYAYGAFQVEADNIVKAYGLDVKSGLVDPKYGVNNMADTSTVNPDYSTGPFFFTRGTLTTDQAGETLLTKEDSWTCIKRLASEVNWRAFCVSGVIYFIDDKDLFASKPFMVISEDSDGIDWIDYDYDEGKRKATVTVTAHLSRWSAPPGCTVQCVDSGIVNGKWLVQDISRSLYDRIGTITMIKPQPVLPEPTTSPTSQAMDQATGASNGTNKKAQPGGARAGYEGPLSTKQNKIVSFARQQLGVTYVYGAESPGKAFDCSGLAQAAYSAANIQIPRVAQDQFNAGTPIYPPATLQPGDLVFFGANSSSIEHVGIYIGNGAMIDAPHTGAVVRVDDGFTSWTNPPYAGAVRLWQ